MTSREPARPLPQLAVACSACQAKPGDLCTSHSGTRYRRYDTHIARMRAWLDATSTTEDTNAPQYPGPGSEIPGQPGFVVATCGHRVAGSEWQAGFRTCERCPSTQQTGPDCDEISEAIQPVISAMEDILHHHTADGEWHPFADNGDTAAVMAEAVHLLDRIETAVKKARAALGQTGGE